MHCLKSGAYSILQKVAHLAEVLESRERKLLDVSRENVLIAEENEQLRM